MYTLAKVMEIAQLDRRTVQYWTEAGALHPTQATNRAGRGIHREFKRDGVIIACVLNGLAQFKLPIGTLLRVSQDIRVRYIVPDAKLRQPLEDAIARQAKVFLWVRGENIAIIADPAAEDCARWFEQLCLENRKDGSGACLLFLNPWLGSVPRSP